MVDKVEKGTIRPLFNEQSQKAFGNDRAGFAECLMQVNNTFERRERITAEYFRLEDVWLSNVETARQNGARDADIERLTNKFWVQNNMAKRWGNVKEVNQAFLQQLQQALTLGKRYLADSLWDAPQLVLGSNVDETDVREDGVKYWRRLIDLLMADIEQRMLDLEKNIRKLEGRNDDDVKTPHPDNDDKRIDTPMSASAPSPQDEVQLAVDYMFGLNGKEMDVKTGMRLLYSAAKDNPDALNSFCKVWELHLGFIDYSLFDEEDWKLIVPIIREAYDDGKRAFGLVLGNDAYHQGKYQAAVNYWTEAGNAGVGAAWYNLGLFLIKDSKDFPAPKHYQDSRRAKAAFEKASAIKWNGTSDALFNLGVICLYSEECGDIPRAIAIFKKLLDDSPDKPEYLWCYGKAGIWAEVQQIAGLTEQLERRSLSPATRRNLKAQLDKLMIEINRKIPIYLPYIKKAAELGNESAQKDYAFLSSFFDD